MDKPANAKDDVKIPKASILDVQARFGFSLYVLLGRVEYEWEPPRCGVCMIFGHDVMLCPKCLVEKPKKQHTNHDGFQYSSSSHGTNVGSRINDLESQIIKGKLVLLDDEGKLLKPSKSTLSSSSNVVSKKVDDLVNKDNDSKVKEEIHGEDPYDDDDFDDPSLTDAQMKFANAFDINFHD
ncbi:hypothetical protein Tco_0761822 [Tanacetum coccineum]